VISIFFSFLLLLFFFFFFSLINFSPQRFSVHRKTGDSLSLADFITYACNKQPKDTIPLIARRRAFLVLYCTAQQRKVKNR
jgi:hypothetical protein